MSRQNAGPPFPTDLGSWLACFRHRLRNDDGHPYSPEQFGLELGVSGATVRRWESGTGRPRAQDILNLAAVTRLSPVQLAFLNLALSATGIVQPPDAATFRQQVNVVLRTTDFPAYILDDLYHIRAWNSFADILPMRVSSLSEGQFLSLILSLPTDLDTPHERIERLRFIIRDFWILSAHRCGLGEYRRLIRELGTDPIFREEWYKLALEDEPPDLPPVGAPFRMHLRPHGSYLVMSSRLMLPPTYYLRIYVPRDGEAMRRLEEARLKGPPVVQFASGVHWARA